MGPARAAPHEPFAEVASNIEVRCRVYPLIRPPREPLATADLLQAFTNHVRLHLPRKRGHEGVHDAVQPAWNDSGAVFEQTLRPSDTHCSTLIRFQRHGLRIEAELFPSTGVFV